MSMQAMASFLEKTQSDEALTENLVQILANNEGDEITSKVIVLAKEHGFEITASDVEETRKQFAQHAEDADGDLSDDDLENVSGGLLARFVGGVFHLIGKNETVKKVTDDAAEFFTRW